MTNDTFTQPLASQVIPPASSSESEVLAMATAMQGFVLDEEHPLALELVGTPEQRSLLIRATSEEALSHARSQLYAHYPQASFVPLAVKDDPFMLREGEAVSVLELGLGAEVYLPLHAGDERRAAQEAGRQLFGVFAALDGLPDGVRAICQIALVPAPPTWSRPYQRKALESALEPERLRQRQQSSAAGGNGPGMVSLVGLGALLALLMLYPQYGKRVPAWVGPALLHLAQGHLPTLLSVTQQWQLYGSLVAIAGMLIGSMLLLRWLRRWLGGTQIYDMKLVGQQVSRMAYRARLRLYVLGPTAPSVSLLTLPPVQRSGTPSLTQLLQEAGQGLRTDVIACWQWTTTTRVLRHQRGMVLARLVAAYRQYHLSAGNYFVPRALSTRAARRLFVLPRDRPEWRAGWWAGLARSPHLIGVEALARLWHLPAGNRLPDLAQVERRQARTLLVPRALVRAAAGQPVLGHSEHAGHRLPFGMPCSCLQKHLLLGGTSGSGKSTVLEHLAVTLMQEGGMVVIDPHGDLVEHLVRLVPAHRRDDVVLLDLSDTEQVVGLNVLDTTQGQGRDKVVSDLVTIMAHLWPTSFGSRMEIVLEYALRTLYEANLRLCQQDAHTGPAHQYTLLDVLPLFTEESFCHAVLEQVKEADPFLLRWWYDYFDPLSGTMQRDRSDPVLSKVAKFESYIARRIVGQGVCTIDLAACIRQQKIVLINLAQGVVGEDVARLLGATLLGLLLRTLEARPNGERPRLPILIDEFQTLPGVNWAKLAELRKYGAAFTLATQSFARLKEVQETLFPTILASITHFLVFQMSAQDAALIAEDLGVAPEDILALPPYTSYVKLSVGEQSHPTFSLRCSPPRGGDETMAVHIRDRCRQRYTQPAAVVDEALKEAIIRAHAAQPRSEAALHASAPVANEPQEEPETPAPVRARQEGGYRGRKGHPHKRREQPQAMHWQETVGQRGPATHAPAKSESKTSDAEAPPAEETPAGEAKEETHDADQR